MNKNSVYQQLRSHLAYLGLSAAAEELPTHLERARQHNIGRHPVPRSTVAGRGGNHRTAPMGSTRLKLANFPTRWKLLKTSTSPRNPASTKTDPGTRHRRVPGRRHQRAVHRTTRSRQNNARRHLGQSGGGHRSQGLLHHRSRPGSTLPQSSPTRKMGQNHAILQHPESVDHRRTRLSADAGRRRRDTVPGDLPTLRERINHPHLQPRSDIVGRDLLRQHYRRGHARPAPPQERGIHHHRRQLPAAKLPSTSKKTQTERRPASLKHHPQTGHFR